MLENKSFLEAWKQLKRKLQIKAYIRQYGVPPPADVSQAKGCVQLAIHFLGIFINVFLKYLFIHIILFY